MIRSNDAVILSHAECRALPFAQLTLACCDSKSEKQDHNGVTLTFKSNARAEKVFEKFNALLNANDEEDEA